MAHKIKKINDIPFSISYEEMICKIDNVIEETQKKGTTVSEKEDSSSNIKAHKNKYNVYTDMNLPDVDLFNIYLHLQHINIKTKTFYSLYTVKNTNKQIQFPNESRKTIKHWVEKYWNDNRNWWRVRNTYIFLNEGKVFLKEYELNLFNSKIREYFKKIIYRQFESRNTNDLISFNTYYVDIDLNTRNHPMDKEEVEKNQVIIANKMIELMSPTSITFTRNGIQATFSIHNEEIPIMNLRIWKTNECMICNYITENITSYLDACSCDAVHLYRLPYSYHRKKKNGDVDDYKVQLYYLSDHLFTTEEIIEKYTVKTLRKHNKNFIDSLKKEYVVSTNDVVNAIKEKNVGFFETYIKKSYARLSYQEKRQYIRNMDMSYFLQVGSALRVSFNSIFREDKKPSAFIDYLTNPKTGEQFYTYTDKGINETRKNGKDGVFCADLIHFVAYVGKMTESEAFAFLCKIFFPKTDVVVDIYSDGIDSGKELDNYITDNVNVFDSYIRKKEYRRVFNAKSQKLYKELNNMFVQYINNFKKESYNGLCILASQEYISNATGLSKSYVKLMLMVFDFCGIIHKQPNSLQYNKLGRISTNYVGIVDLTGRNFQDLLPRRIETFNRYFHQMCSITQKELDQYGVFL